MNTDDVYREHRLRTQRELRQRDTAPINEGRISVADFARQHGLNAWVLRRKLRMAGYDRKGRATVPIKDLLRFTKGMR